MSGRPPLALADAISRPWKSVRLAASTSFTADEVSALRSLLAKLRSGGDVRILAPDTEYLTRDLEHALESATRALVDHLAATMRCSRRQAVPIAVERIRELTAPRSPA